MKNLITSLLLAAVTLSSSHALTIGVDTGINITNDGTQLVPVVAQNGAYAPSKKNPQGVFDWLADGGTDDPGLISLFNTITGLELPLLTDMDAYFPGNETSSKGPHVFDAGSYYAVVHFGGYFAAWYFEADGSSKYSFVSKAKDIPDAGALNGGGFSNARVFRAPAPPPEVPAVPDSGATVALLGAALLGLVGLRRHNP